MSSARRLTQHDIAKLAGVSQATVSLVLNDAQAAATRIPGETRERILKIIRETGYVADPIARRMAKGLNRILGVFTYEPAFPSAQADFFAPFLLGIEEEAQRQNYDLLLLTSAGIGEKREIFGDGNRLRLADGCLVLGRQFNRTELKQLVQGEYPFVAVGRRENAGGKVPYVGGGYADATKTLVGKARALGHSRLAYVGPKGPAESVTDRWKGFSDALENDAELVLHIPHAGQPPHDILEALIASDSTAVFFVELADAIKVETVARQRGLSIPADMSFVVLGSHIRPERTTIQFASFNIPREEMGRQATAMLIGRIETSDPVRQVLLPCEPLEGETLGPVKSRRN
ncbi:LacI family DNA-binding transcriptional regulator [Phyllobacterium sp. YR531]|uniref:LacI family DNA-binding transcriptional regulator n=1 Tax=Phyllobacterium sp. YR531 TaxID=1144343 RepID=UPI00026FB295|nr:LacI family DNA-binding transcriptional regulator [Phyllobacterium sp. YR531]EJN02312.1 transcriptional regulator [Phyllobacterium sp. YR531]